MNSLLIDDQREFPNCHIARTYKEGIIALEKFRWDILYIDHDLGDHVDNKTVTGRELTGYDVLCWLEEHPAHVPGNIILVTNNPSGRQKMKLVIDKLMKEQSK